MAKQNTKAPAATTPAPAATATRTKLGPDTLLQLGKLPRHLGSDTKHGTGGTNGTWAATYAAVQATPNGQATYGALQAIAAANGDPKFTGYAVRSKWLQVVAPAS